MDWQGEPRALLSGMPYQREPDGPMYVSAPEIVALRLPGLSDQSLRRYVRREMFPPPEPGHRAREWLLSDVVLSLGALGLPVPAAWGVGPSTDLDPRAWARALPLGELGSAGQALARWERDGGAGVGAATLGRRLTALCGWDGPLTRHRRDGTWIYTVGPRRAVERGRWRRALPQGRASV